jgi:hypothetical protein
MGKGGGAIWTETPTKIFAADAGAGATTNAAASNTRKTAREGPTGFQARVLLNIDPKQLRRPAARDESEKFRHGAFAPCVDFEL